MQLEKFSMGIGDRFGHEGAAQLRALQTAEALGVRVTPVWNKSNREHTIIGTSPEDARRCADAAVKVCNWQGAYHVDADHIGLGNVDKFIASCDFFTIDVADHIGKAASPAAVSAYLQEVSRFKGTLHIPNMASSPIEVTDDLLAQIASKYLFAVEEAARVYRHLVDKKGAGNFITEVSADETSAPQTPAELFFILAAVAQQGIAAQTIAPKFTGAFLKGIDYVGDVRKFAREFEDDMAVVEFAKRTFDLSPNLKLSIHSGSDKFSLYPIMHRTLAKAGAGIHLKTAGTTWLEEVIGLASVGGEGLQIAKDIYAAALERFEEMAQPYLSVIDIDRVMLPPVEEVNAWSAEDYVTALEHHPSNERFNIHFRQLIHISFRVAAEMGARFTDLLKRHREVIESHVTNNVLHRHVEPLFLGSEGEETRGT
jgi:tagaturonate epimerase